MPKPHCSLVQLCPRLLDECVHLLHGELNLIWKTSDAQGLLVSKLISFYDDKKNSPGLSGLANHPRTANEGLVRIQYKCLVPIYVFPEIKLLFPKQNYNVLSPRSYTHISVMDLYISRIGVPFLLQGNM
jgi:hypothetical protein